MNEFKTYAGKEISLEYLTEEKFYPLGTTDEYFEAPYEEYPITICGQTVILINGELAAALLSLPEYNRVSNPQDVRGGRRKEIFTNSRLRALNVLTEASTEEAVTF